MTMRCACTLSWTLQSRLPIELPKVFGVHEAHTDGAPSQGLRALAYM